MGKLLDDFLTAHRKDQKTISNTLYKELLRVEAELTNRQKQIEQARQSICNNAINIKSISEATGIARKTFYNNDLLNSFVRENAMVNFTERDNIQKLKEKISDKEKEINLLLYRDIDEIKLRNDIAKIQNELSIANKRVKSLEKQHEKDVALMHKNSLKELDCNSDEINENYTIYNNGSKIKH